MQSVRLHVASNGEIWAMSRCSVCGDIDKHPLLAAATGAVRCKQCGRQMDIAGATVEAVEAEKGKGAASRLPASLPALANILHSDGLVAALAAINATVPYRYTGVFLVEGGMLRNLALHDKQNPRVEVWAPFPLQQSFCSLIIGSGDPLTVREAKSDSRGDVRAHPAGDIVQAYCGVPILADDGKVLGTLCHFDEQRIEATVDLVSMLQIPRLLRPYLMQA